MESDNFFDKNPGSLHGRRCAFQGQEVAHFGISIHHNKDICTTLRLYFGTLSSYTDGTGIYNLAILAILDQATRMCTARVSVL